MSNCLVTKLKGSSSNADLLKIGEMRLKVNKVDSPNSNTQKLDVSFNKETTLSIIGEGYFTDNNLTANKGKTLTAGSRMSVTAYVSNGNFDISVSDKYSISEISKDMNSKNKVVLDMSFFKYSTLLKKIVFNNSQACGNVDDLKTCVNLEYLILSNSQVSGKVNELKSLTKLKNLSLYNTQVSGNVGELKALTALSNLEAYNTKISGNVGELKALTALSNMVLNDTLVEGNVGELKTLTSLQYLSLNNTNVSGNIDELKTLTKMKMLNLSNPNVPLTGDIGELGTLTQCTDISLDYGKYTGDLANIPVPCRYVSFKNDAGSVFTWGTRPSSAKIVAIEGNAELTNVDKMLQDQAECQVGFSSGSPSWYKAISVVGNRTSASDAAVQTLQSKGYTISITPKL